MRGSSSCSQAVLFVTLLANSAFALWTTRSVTNLTNGPHTGIRRLCQSDNCSIAGSNSFGAVKANKDNLQGRALPGIAPSCYSYARRLWGRIERRFHWTEYDNSNRQQYNQVWRFPSYPNEEFYGIRSLGRNTAILLITRKGIFISVIFAPHPMDGTQQENFLTDVYRVIRDGNQVSRVGIGQLRAEGLMFTPDDFPIKIYIITPNYSINWVTVLRDGLARQFTGVTVAETEILSYRVSADRPRASRVTVEIATDQMYLQNPEDGIRYEIGAWRLWVGMQPRKEGFFLQNPYRSSDLLSRTIL